MIGESGAVGLLVDAVRKYSAKPSITTVVWCSFWDLTASRSMVASRLLCGASLTRE